MNPRRRLPWLCVVASLPLMAGAVIYAETDACATVVDPPARGVEMTSFEPADHAPYLLSECRVEWSDGTVAENTNFNWGGILLATLIAALAWAAGAGLARLLSRRRAAASG